MSLQNAPEGIEDKTFAIANKLEFVTDA